MKDFMNTAETPHFDTAAIARGARRKRATAIAGIATALVVAGAGTALAAGAAGGSSHTTQRTAAATADSTTLLVRTSDGTATEQLAGVSSARARVALVHFGLTPSFTRVRKADCPKQEDAVVLVSPHAPTAVHAGDTVLVTTCYR